MSARTAQPSVALPFPAVALVPLCHPWSTRQAEYSSDTLEVLEISRKDPVAACQRDLRPSRTGVRRAPPAAPRIAERHARTMKLPYITLP